MRANEFHGKMDPGENIARLIEREKVRRPRKKHKRINVELPLGILQPLDREARRLGITLQSLIKVWIAERLQREREART